MPASTVESGPPSSGLEPEPDRLAGPGVHADHRRRPPARREPAAEPDRSQTTVWVPPSSTIARRWSADDEFAACANSQRNPERWPVPRERDRRRADRGQRRRGRWRRPTSPAGQPVTSAADPDAVDVALERPPPVEVAAGLPRAQRPDRGRGIGPVGVDGPAAADLEVVVERAAAWSCGPRRRGRPAGTQARSARYRTASLLRAGLGRDHRCPWGSPGPTSRTCTRRSGTCRTASRAIVPWEMYRSLALLGLVAVGFGPSCGRWRERRVVEARHVGGTFVFV